jgi:hypothetical protein
VSIYARTFWGNVDFALFNTKYLDDKTWTLLLIKNSFEIDEIINEIDSNIEAFYSTKKYKNEPVWHTRFNEDLEYWIDYLENLK